MAANKEEITAELTAFMHEVTPSLLHTAWLLTGDAGRAEELVHEALVSTCRAWPRLRDEDPLAHARRALLDQRAGAQPRFRHVDSAGPTGPVVGMVGGDRERGSEELVRLLRGIPARQRRVVVLRYGSGLSEQAVADLLDLSVAAVDSTASRGMAALQARQAATSSTGGRAVTGRRFEDELASALAEAPAPPMTVDPEDVLLHSRRASRTRRASLAGLVAVVALIAVAVALLGPRERGTGGPDLTGRVRRPVSAGLVLGSEHFAATISSPGRDTNLDFYLVDADGHRQRVWGRSTEGLGSGASFGNAGTSGAILGVVPSDAVTVSACFLGQPLSAGDVTTAPLPGTGYQAVGILPQDAAMASRFLGVGWVDHRGVRSTSVPTSDTVATFTLSGSGNQVSVWTDPQDGSWGVYLGDATESAGLPLAVGRREVVWRSQPQSVRNDPSHPDYGFAYGLLPEGVRDVWFTLADGARASGTVQATPLAGVHLTAFVLELDRPTGGAAVGHQLRALSWTNPDGSRDQHTFD
ncbi:SigE family RNA polymerase sigma factor [Oryzihumus leptocrescens]|uniref:DNA-directed RNA polymerase specialized sigma24 family protein n=1 Tax=Oryzihumus leptocrescens TaxID=297536 RepID=A0A542ZMM9_9MICO|nr:SigE family RNA polymerase sigma factor [Oryzihumus leptocrescens]TQL61470.1 DNA-directed RNA polymerase specialized sigma24 family protein [Oryzihumus leptocrescens]